MKRKLNNNKKRNFMSYKIVRQSRCGVGVELMKVFIAVL